MRKPVVDRAIRRLRRLRKQLYQALMARAVTRRVVFVFGCQRSGTSLMMNLLDEDVRSRVYREPDEVFVKMQLKPLDEVEAVFQRVSQSLVVAKPLLDSDRTVEILGFFPDSVAVWMYRHYKAVARSHVMTFGPDSPERAIRRIVSNASEDWRCRGVSEQTRYKIAECYDRAHKPLDAAALLWYARNRIFLDADLPRHSRVVLCKYEDLVSTPVPIMAQIYDLIQLSFPGESITAQIDTRGIGRGREVRLLPEVDRLCEQLWQEMSRSLNKQEQ